MAQQPPQQDHGLPGRGGRHAGVAPEAEGAVARRHHQRVVPPGVDCEDLAGQSILGLRPQRVEGARITEGPGPLSPVGVQLKVRLALLVAHHRPEAVLPADAPEDLVARQEGEVHPAVPRRLHIGALLPAPVLVVANTEEEAVAAEKRGAEAVGVHPRGVGHVIAMPLQEADHRILGTEGHVDGPVVPGDQWPVVGYLVGSPLGVLPVEALAPIVVHPVANARATVGPRPAPAIVGLPGCVAGLEQHVRPPVIIAHNKPHVAGMGLVEGVEQPPRSGSAVGVRSRRWERVLAPSHTGLGKHATRDGFSGVAAVGPPGVAVTGAPHKAGKVQPADCLLGDGPREGAAPV
mmetsp:Transcript_29033/g.81803  ORF Transcript_29033/g.81803 Transcript_29033/m.81803 type:complete len:348 (+) Transcript_29033:916-1959(+)